MARSAEARKRDSTNDRRSQEDRVQEHATPRTPVIYEVVRQHGEEEMARPAVSLWWSGIAAGLSISFSLLAQGILTMHLPDAPWRILVAAFGYPIGFLMVVMSRQQLFTENTITVVLPVMAQPTFVNFARGARMWGIVLAANLTGTLIAALFCMFTPVIPPELRTAMLDISRHTLDYSWLEMAFRGVTSGYLIAAMVWLIPAAGYGGQVRIVILMTYLIGAGGFTHIVAGSVEAFMLLANGDVSVWSMLSGFTLPVLIGNTIGGTALFALLSHAQVMKEM